jgi:hypothetical protein
MTAADWLRLATERADDGSAKLRGVSLGDKYAEDALHEAADQLRTAARHIEDALLMLSRERAS